MAWSLGGFGREVLDGGMVFDGVWMGVFAFLPFLAGFGCFSGSLLAWVGGGFVVQISSWWVLWGASCCRWGIGSGHERQP